MTLKYNVYIFETLGFPINSVAIELLHHSKSAINKYLDPDPVLPQILYGSISTRIHNSLKCRSLSSS